MAVSESSKTLRHQLPFIFSSVILQNDNTNIYFTDLLNGELTLSQNGTVRSTEYISSAHELNETVSILPTDLEFLTKNATYITTYWFVDCEYMGASNSLTSISKYLNENQKYDIEVR